MYVRIFRQLFTLNIFIKSTFSFINFPHLESLLSQPISFYTSKGNESSLRPISNVIDGKAKCFLSTYFTYVSLNTKYDLQVSDISDIAKITYLSIASPGN